MTKLARINHTTLPPLLETRAPTFLKAPLPRKEYLEVLADAGAVGRQIRAVMTLSGPMIEELKVTTISDFTLAFEWTMSERIGYDHFAAFAEAGTCRMVDPRFPSPTKKVAFSVFARDRLALIEEISARFFMTPAMPSDIVLAPWACDCCFETQHLDYLKSLLDLRGIGSMLIIRIMATNFGQAFDRVAASPFLTWMQAAGFEPSWFLGFDNLVYLNDLALDEEANGRGSVLYPLPGRKIGMEVLALRQTIKEKIGHNEPYFDHLFNLYLVFQRIECSDRVVLNKIFAEAMQWEREHAEERRPRKGKETSRLIDRFSKRLPFLLDQL